MRTLDERLLLAANMYDPCQLGADIGTDHALLPAHLLRNGICERMLLCDVSEKALAQARKTVEKYGLQERTTLLLTDGLSKVEETCGCISCTGMGGDTMAGILRAGREKLHGATLVLSCHTEPEKVREALQEIGYRFIREEPVLCAGRYYIVWKCVPGQMQLSADEVRFGSLLFKSENELLRPYTQRRLELAELRVRGLSGTDRAEELADARYEAAFYAAKLEEMK